MDPHASTRSVFQFNDALAGRRQRSRRQLNKGSRRCRLRRLLVDMSLEGIVVQAQDRRGLAKPMFCSQFGRRLPQRPGNPLTWRTSFSPVAKLPLQPQQRCRHFTTFFRLDAFAVSRKWKPATLSYPQQTIRHAYRKDTNVAAIDSDRVRIELTSHDGSAQENSRLFGAAEEISGRPVAQENSCWTMLPSRTRVIGRPVLVSYSIVGSMPKL